MKVEDTNLSTPENMQAAPLGVWYNDKFITAIDWGTRFPVTIFNSACQGVNIEHPLKQQLRELRKNVEYCADTNEEIIESLHSIPKKKRTFVVNRINYVDSALKKQLDTLIGVDCWAIANLVIDNCPYGSYLALEDHECLKDAFTKDNGEDDWMRKAHLDMLYWVLANLAQRKNIKIVYVNKTRTSLICPVCGKFDNNARHKDKHIYRCKKCGFVANDDITAAMNIYRLAEKLIFGDCYMDMQSAANAIPRQPASYIPLIPQ